MQLLNNVTRNTSKVTQYKYSDAIPLHWCNTIDTILPQTTIILLNTASANHQRCYSMPIYTHQYQNWYSVYLTMLRCFPNWQRYCTDYCFWLLPPIIQKHTRSAILWQSWQCFMHNRVWQIHSEHFHTLSTITIATHCPSLKPLITLLPWELL